jgi:hypothetical protein
MSGFSLFGKDARGMPMDAFGRVVRGGPLRVERLTPRQTIRNHCIDCVGGASQVRHCQGDKLYDGPCLFYPYRMGRGRPSVQLIRKYCLSCMGGSKKLVRECPSRTCSFLPYRMGKSQRAKPRLSQERRQELSKALRLRLKSQETASLPLFKAQELTNG